MVSKPLAEAAWEVVRGDEEGCIATTSATGTIGQGAYKQSMDTIAFVFAERLGD
jgi:hypothetical protein